MNEHLKFSWGHIIAFIALIVLSYTTFVGLTYLSGGNFLFASIGTVLTVAVFVAIFIGAQSMKASGNRISRRIVWERILIFASPLVFVAGMVAVTHFWTVVDKNQEVTATFRNSIESSKQLFSDYETYSETRLANYEKSLDNIIAARKTNPRLFKQAGFEASKYEIQKENMIQTLRLQLLSNNYDTVKNAAIQWIDASKEGANTLNVFLIGNTREIQKAVEKWEKQLTQFSEKRISNEELVAPVENFYSDGANAAILGIHQVNGIFKQREIPTVAAIIFGIGIYLMLLMPYFIQQRHGRQVAMRYSLFSFLSSRKDTQMVSGGFRKRKPAESSLHINDSSPDAEPNKKKFQRITL